jgi:hypothetical protein
VIEAGEAVVCPACGGLYEGPVKLAGGGILRGHVQGDEVCRERAQSIPKRKPTAPPMPSSPEPMTEEERERKAERIRQKIRKEGLAL